MKVDLIIVYSLILGLSSLITASKVILDLIKKPGIDFKNIKVKQEDLEERVEKLESDNDKIEDIIKKIDNLIILQSTQNCSINTSLAERELLIKSNKVLIKAVSSLLRDANMDPEIKKELNKAENDLDDFIFRESHRNNLENEIK